MKEGEGQGLDVFGDRRGRAKRGERAAVEAEGKTTRPCPRHNVCGDFGKRQRAAAIDEDAELRRHCPQRGLLGEHRFNVARNGM